MQCLSHAAQQVFAQPPQPVAIADARIEFEIHVVTQEDDHVYTEKFNSSCDAVSDALARFSDARKIHVTTAQKEKTA